MNANEIVILSAARTPIGKFQGAYAALAAIELGAIAIRAAVERAGIGSAMVDECIMGNVISAGLGQAPARQAALAAGLAESVGALTINKVCGSSLKAVMLASAIIRAGDADLIVAGGMENMSQAPYLLPQARTGYRLGNAELTDALIHDGLWCAIEKHHMGNSAEWIANTFNISREDQDAWALRSHQHAIIAQDSGRFEAEIVPVEISTNKGNPTTIAADQPPRRDTTEQQLAALRPAFLSTGSVTAGNAPGLTDGAAALVVTHAALAADLGIQPLAQIVGYAQAAVKPLELFTAPVFAIQKLLKQTSTTIANYDLFEINEAFAAQLLANASELGLDWNKLNVNGGAIALGHPIGASGARVLTTLIHALRLRGGGRGIAALCLGGGEAVAMAVAVG